MRVKKQKRHRKAVRFYAACFGFREPFKVLCDGTFVHHLLLNKITPADIALANALGAPVKIFTTRCVLGELRSLGDSYAESLNAARNLLTARCDHEKRKSAVSCITRIIGENNSEHFFVATQDAELRKKFQKVPGVPLIYGLRNALFLEQPSAFQHQFVRSVEEDRSHMTDLEYKLLNVKKKNVAFEEAKDSSDANEDKNDGTFTVQAIQTNFRKKRDLKDTVQFKRKRAKGPNPLSCKKKKPRENTNNAASVKENGNGDTTVRSRNRKRKRSRKSKNVSKANV
ncbi:rRNA-processing protein utp23-like [Coffea arabica]|uniref:rRNA-processing protein UTP23 homolog n=1 Tax=Coffea arabica TaxID=13443 RepID=A0A6P6VVK5_COFAR|nr:rRNA-processing protein UTP23 homolog [Coffea arabica]XP_027107137.1 rRNA-processing protein UTP23 homolog [Coffea arabica]XP_027107138.1 rRNA-processing protein UTP23 homolog [Coffea arabica]XP_027107139.1 rRNA-processing protein UTP23 homolog [Coffea arabica]